MYPRSEPKAVTLEVTTDHEFLHTGRWSDNRCEHSGERDDSH